MLVPAVITIVQAVSGVNRDDAICPYRRAGQREQGQQGKSGEFHRICLHDGDNSWYQHQFAAFTKATGIKVQYVEGGSGAIVERLAKERTNPQADVLVTVPPFIQRAAKEQLLAEFQPQDSARIPGVHDRYSPLVNNYLTFKIGRASCRERVSSPV